MGESRIMVCNNPVDQSVLPGILRDLLAKKRILREIVPAQKLVTLPYTKLNLTQGIKLQKFKKL